MNLKYCLIAILISVLIGAFLLNYGFLGGAPSKGNTRDVFVGVDAAYASVEEIKTLVDEVSSYTNFFVIGSTGITYNETKLNEICQYVYDKGLSFIIFTEKPIPTQWLDYAKNSWGDQFLGLYAYDEVGGRQLDLYKYRPVWEADNCTDASDQFITMMNMTLRYVARNYTSYSNFRFFTSDYALYWFDYKAGYDVVFTEFGWSAARAHGWNYSRQLNVALCRGAATAQNREWGVIITWTYDEPPYIESGQELYDDMVLAYQNGANYIVVLDTNGNYTHGILTEEHLAALEQFWQYTANSPRDSDVVNDRVAFGLPKDFAYGLRGPDDKIWGLWNANDTSYELCVNLDAQLKCYDTKLDVIYDDMSYNNMRIYSKITFWNGTVLSF
jgi:hypothetical protein